MKFDGIEVCQNARYLDFCIPRDTLFHYKRKFINSDRRSVNGNSESANPRPNTLATIASLKKMINKKLKYSSQPYLISEYGWNEDASHIITYKLYIENSSY